MPHRTDYSDAKTETEPRTATAKCFQYTEAPGGGFRTPPSIPWLIHTPASVCALLRELTLEVDDDVAQKVSSCAGRCLRG